MLQKREVLFDEEIRGNENKSIFNFAACVVTDYIDAYFLRFGSSFFGSRFFGSRFSRNGEYGSC